MNITNTNESDYYKKMVLEIGILLDSIKLPSLPTEPLTLATLERYAESGKSYNLIQNTYKDVMGKFYIPSLFPLVDKSNGAEEFIYKSPNTYKSNKSIKPIRSYEAANYVNLIIPKYIVMQFRDVIPKDTIFLIGFNGEEKEINNINVVGLYGAGMDYNYEEEENG
jgi:hypothetical protein